MKLSFSGKWEIELGRSFVPVELEAAVKETVKLTDELDKKYVDDTKRGDGGTRESQRGAGKD